VSQQHIVVVNAAPSGPARTETWQGREYRVVPSVLVRSQVLSNNLGLTLLPPDAITTTWADMWNGVYVLAGEHPTQQGQHVSARDPEILNVRGIGNIFRARVENIGDSEDRKLVAEVWIDAARAALVPELAVILARVDVGQSVELSTGFPVVVEESPGAYNNEPYDLVLRPTGVDHLAVFSQGRGACSVSDGCGLGANHVGNCELQKEVIVENVETTTEPKGWFFRLINSLKSFGSEAADAINLENASDDEWRMLLGTALQEQLGQRDWDVVVADVYRESGQVVFFWWTPSGPEPAGHHFFRAAFEVGDDDTLTIGTPERVMLRKLYEMVPALAGQAQVTHEENAEMNREQMIAKLEADGTSREALNALSDCQLTVLVGVEDDVGTAGQGEQNRAEDGSSGASQTEAGDAEANKALLAQLSSMAELLKATNARLDEQAKTIAELEEGVAPAVADRERERTELIEALSGNARVAASGLTQEEMEGMSIEGLRKVAALARGTSYVGQGGPVGTVHKEDEPVFARPIPYWEKPGSGVQKQAEA
jgi:hypothetical protein